MNLVATICLSGLVTAGTNSQVSPATDVPQWVGEELPFDASGYFALPEENAAPLYSGAFEEFTEEMYWQNPETNSAGSIRDRQKMFGRVYRRFQSDPASVESSQIDRVLKSYEKGIALLRIAQQQPDCVFTTEIQGIHTTVFSTHLTADRELLKVLDLKIYHDLRSGNVPEAIRMLEIQLRLARDLRPQGQAVDQLVACQLEQVAFQKNVPRILAASTLDSEACHLLFELLVQHQRATDIDPVLKSEQYNQLFWRKLFSQLEEDEFDVGSIAAEYDLRVANPTTGNVLVPLFTQVFNYEFNSVVIRRIADQLAKRDPQAARLLQRIDDSEKAEDQKKRERLIAGIVIQVRLGLNRDVDFSHDRTILNRRYGRIAEIRQLAEPHRVRKLEPFGQQWALKSNVSNTTLLQLFEPAQITVVGRAVQRSTLLLRVVQCLTAVKHWELEHDELPPDLISATTNVDLNSMPVDPHNGKPLQLISNDEPAIYAPGVDQRWSIPRSRRSTKRE